MNAIALHNHISLFSDDEDLYGKKAHPENPRVAELLEFVQRVQQSYFVHLYELANADPEMTSAIFKVPLSEVNDFAKLDPVDIHNFLSEIPASFLSIQHQPFRYQRPNSPLSKLADLIDRNQLVLRRSHDCEERWYYSSLVLAV
ncbi:hypothetical protein [Motilimonas eburnea]|uniref:hypothetical protein n=1 Tax=Motilimonas eburnea TaxID=1737488 RepID=UPI001E610554|nr:hypothetical protein [Motilimonas eburnea]MCE2571779.1 hypothetical protein [Motilimonas eburnea]